MNSIFLLKINKYEDVGFPFTLLVLFSVFTCSFIVVCIFIIFVYYEFKKIFSLKYICGQCFNRVFD